MLFDELEKYAGSGAYPFHMPGHKRRFKGFDPYSIDITEIDGFDDMHRPSGVIKELNDGLRDHFGGDEVSILINGSTSGVLTAISACVQPGEKILICSNCHKSAKDAVFLRNINAVFFDPEDTDETGIKGGADPEKIRDLLNNDSGIKAVFITSPTYDGFLSDVRAVADICHNSGIPLICDSAHGAHAGLYRAFTEEYRFENASLNGADIVVKSLHKNLPAFTQTAILTVNGSLVDRERLHFFYSAYQSTSPSYVLMAGADRMLKFLRKEGEAYFEALDRELKETRQEAEECGGVRFTGPGQIGRNAVYGFDPTKLIMIHRDKTADELYSLLRTKYRLQPEKKSGNGVLLMTSLMDDREGFSRLRKAVREIR